MATLSEQIGTDQFERSAFQIEPVSVIIPDLSPAFHGYKIASIADIHLGQWITPARLDGVIGLINEQRPDLVAIIGDFFSYEVDRLSAEMVASLSKLSPKDLSVAVLGNHDHWVGEETVREVLRRSDIVDLSNDVHTLHRGDAALHITGVDSVMLRKNRLDVVLAKLPPSGPAILLAHEPDFADVSATTGRFSLQISGHSHGGQLILPGIGTLVRGPHAKKYPLGRYRIGEMVQYTSRGLGTNVFWIRINCPPEITVFTLASKEGL
ncbi:MAG TPA: metallophosphoesterase [Candidatus Bathyarchaeia archaeon]|nr:metallophosphoesterase [Candidatus Bathyarchaeia archaeon]